MAALTVTTLDHYDIRGRGVQLAETIHHPRRV